MLSVRLHMCSIDLSLHSDLKPDNKIKMILYADLIYRKIIVADHYNVHYFVSAVPID